MKIPISTEENPSTGKIDSWKINEKLLFNEEK